MLASEGTLIVACSTGKKTKPVPRPSSQVLADGEIACIAEVVEVEDQPPDGGLCAWFTVFGVGIGMGATIGIVISWGTWQAYYEEVGLRTKSSSEIAWIGSVQNAMTYAPGLFIGRLFDMGYFRLPVFASSILFVACMFLAAECTQYWQLLLFQGFGVGLAGGVFFNIGSMVLTHWFKEKLGLALALAYSGFSVFGCIFPIVTETLLQRIGYWLLVLSLSRASSVFIHSTAHCHKLDSRRKTLGDSRPGGPAVQLVRVQKPVYAFYVAALVVNSLALMNASTYITLSAVDAAVNADVAYGLVAIINAASALGQLAGGSLADHYDPLNVLIGATLLGAAVNFAWPFGAAHAATLILVAVLIGLSTGGVWASMVQPLERMGRPGDVGRRIGMGFTLVALGMVVGSPVAGAIFDVTGSYGDVGYCSGYTGRFNHYPHVIHLFESEIDPEHSPQPISLMRTPPAYAADGSQPENPTPGQDPSTLVPQRSAPADIFPDFENIAWL
uniref:MFS domain-containing protein n=1 Tax=Ganoderma boninense TaxID=34458 RepID=A0A5K1JRU1_9APHY|nr:MFS domain-containing protein [Ganoderma boninense]